MQILFVLHLWNLDTHHLATILYFNWLTNHFWYYNVLGILPIDWLYRRPRWIFSWIPLRNTLSHLLDSWNYTCIALIISQTVGQIVLVHPLQ